MSGSLKSFDADRTWYPNEGGASAVGQRQIQDGRGVVDLLLTLEGRDYAALIELSEELNIPADEIALRLLRAGLRGFPGMACDEGFGLIMQAPMIGILDAYREEDT